VGVRNFGLTTFVLSSTSTLVLAWTLDRNDFETYRLPGRKRFRLAIHPR